MNDSIEARVKDIALKAKEASVALALKTDDERNSALAAMAAALRSNAGEIIDANSKDVANAKDGGVSDALIDRLMLDEKRLEEMACALEDLANLDDPLGVVQDERVLYNGIGLKRISVPLGVVAIVYEARPNVTADAAGICLKSGNSCILRGGSLAENSNIAISRVLAEAAESAGMPEGCIENIPFTDRSATDALMQLHGIVDVLIPRGGVGLIRHCVEASKVPVIETGTGNCHVYVHESADLGKALDIVENSKCRRYGVCNACETVLVDKDIANDFLPGMFEMLARHGVKMHCDPLALEIAEGHAADTLDADAATDKDWATEYLAPEIAIKCVDGVQEAIEHINKYGTHHSEAIVAQDAIAQDCFLKGVDAAAVYSNAATAFTDGGQFGLGAEIGISTQKLHVRGPFAIDALTSYKYLLKGDGQIRG